MPTPLPCPSTPLALLPLSATADQAPLRRLAAHAVVSSAPRPSRQMPPTWASCRALHTLLKARWSQMFPRGPQGVSLR